MNDPHSVPALLEIAFGTNVALSTFQRVRDLVAAKLPQKNLESWARILAGEVVGNAAENKQMVNELKSKLQKWEKAHNALQDLYYRPARITAVIFAVLIPIILYLPVSQWIVNWSGILILPLPLYVAFSWVTAGGFVLYVRFQLWWRRKAVRLLVGPEKIYLPPPGP